ncbi:MAG: protein kinase [bacterium]|nr:protein kinase [bacterium]
MPPCPDSELLHQLEAGVLSDAQADALWPHLTHCQACTDRLEQMRNEDLFGRVLRRAHEEQDSKVAASESGDEATPEQHSSHRPGWDIPDYERVRLCGEGAFGTVWAVRDRVGVHRALKVIDLERLESAGLRCRESTALEAYCRHVERHPNLIQVFHVGVRGRVLYYTMELADDDVTRTPVRDAFPETYRPLTLRRVIQQGPVGPDTAIEVVLRLLRGLSRLHALGMVHRDIKPANIVFVDRQPKLSDIGMITADSATPSNVGTPDYMPPDGTMDLTADTYAMGRVLYELLTAEPADDFPKLPDTLADDSEQWDLPRIGDVLTKACAPEAVDRYPHAQRLHEALESCRVWSYDALFGLPDSRAGATAPQRPRRGSLTPILLAALYALPWALGLVFAFVLGLLAIQKLL